jgi:hypothetical protein
MMFTLTINTGNDAFHERPERGLSQVLQNLAFWLEEQDLTGVDHMSGPLRDYNGNTVGEWTYRTND